MIKNKEHISNFPKMQAIIYLFFIFTLQVFPGSSNAQKDQQRQECTDNTVCKQFLVISWQKNVLHVIDQPESKKETGLKKMIRQTSTEVKKMQKSIASVDHTQDDAAGIFQYRKEADGLKEKGRTVMIH